MMNLSQKTCRIDDIYLRNDTFSVLLRLGIFVVFKFKTKGKCILLKGLHREGVFRAIFERRDVRQFNSKPIPNESLEKILLAGHHAPSVGFMQPWNFILVTSEEIKERLAWAADKERRALAIHYEGERANQFLSLKIEGIRQAPLTICITCDPTRGGSHVLGRNSIPETDILSTACAIQNMWLASYAEGLAMGWVSFYKKNDVRDILNIPPHIEPVALLSIGYTDQYPTVPILETANWEKRRSLNELIFYEAWDSPDQENSTLLEKIVKEVEPLNPSNRGGGSSGV
jgi:5,6-dimethylbenzimidazole synthase